MFAGAGFGAGVSVGLMVASGGGTEEVVGRIELVLAPGRRLLSSEGRDVRIPVADKMTIRILLRTLNQDTHKSGHFLKRLGHLGEKAKDLLRSSCHSVHLQVDPRQGEVLQPLGDLMELLVRLLGCLQEDQVEEVPEQEEAEVVEAERLLELAAVEVVEEAVVAEEVVVLQQEEVVVVVEVVELLLLLCQTVQIALG